MNLAQRYQKLTLFCDFDFLSIAKYKMFYLSFIHTKFQEIYQTGIASSQICIGYSVGVSVLLMIATTLLYPTKHVLQSFVELEIINNIRPSLNDDQDDLDAATDSSFSLMRSQDQLHVQL